ncbi:MAG TPA: undecaprenyldiphospho-muramoylpentapeptide beta-N-acetylglucosaminyltransferase [Bryobacteraceae bacterium]|nr:undecaprenyldiphospho-muramoylpentapeptide beta-N-acetylglucosaminyltransferase [Bryobacteraceae bacterium]
MAYSFVFSGGGTGGHVFPALAVARILDAEGHRILFVGRRQGIEARLVAEAGFDMAFIRSSGLNRVGWRAQLRSASLLPGSIASAWSILRKFKPHAILSLGGFVAGPVMLAARGARLPFVIMEPNAVPGFANRTMARSAARILLGFPGFQPWSPPGKTEVAGVPVRPEIFKVQPKQSGPFTIFVTGGSQGSRTLNRASRESWPLFCQAQSPVQFLHQSGTPDFSTLAQAFAVSKLSGEVVPFISNMAEAFSRADLVIGRSGAGGVSEIAAAGMPSILVPLPFAADDHQRRNAETFVRAGAARMILDSEMTGEHLFREVEDLRTQPEQLAHMREQVRPFAKPHAAERAAAVLREIAAKRGSAA